MGAQTEPPVQPGVTLESFPELMSGRACSWVGGKEGLISPKDHKLNF